MIQKITWLWFCAIFSVISCAMAQSDSAEILERRQYYEKLFASTNDYIDIVFIKAYKPLEDSTRKYLEEAIQCRDELIDCQIVDYLGWLCLPYGFRGFLQAPPKEQLEQIRKIEEVREFLFRHADALKPSWPIFLVIATLYGDEPSVVEYLVTKSAQNEAYAYLIIRELAHVGICTDLITPLLIESLQNNSPVRTLSEVAQYLVYCPFRETLPFLVAQLKKKNEELSFANIQFEKYLYKSDLHDKEKADQEPLVAPEDDLRMMLCRALLAYPPRELMPYKEEILDIGNHVDFGPQSRGTYEWLLDRLTRKTIEPAGITWKTEILKANEGE